MKKIVFAAAIWMLCLPAVRAQDLEPIPEEVCTKFGKMLSDLADKIVNPQVKVTADADKANGVHVPEKLGIMVVPEKGLKESEELAAKFQAEKGTPIGYLFLYRLAPVVEGKRVAADQMWDVTVTDEEGTSRNVLALQLAVRQLSDDDYRLYVYGKNSKPIADAKFSEGAGSSDAPVAVTIRDPNHTTREGTAVITVFGKYQASFRVGHAE